MLWIANGMVFVGVVLQMGGVWWTLRALVKDSPREALVLYLERCPGRRS